MRIALAVIALSGVLFAADDSRVRELIAQLGADDAAKRDAAATELERLGSEDESGKVEDLLTEASFSKDVEVSSRSSAILDKLRYWEETILVTGRQVGRNAFPNVGAFDLAGGDFLWIRPVLRLFDDWWIGPRRRGALAYLVTKYSIEGVDLRTGATRWGSDGFDGGARLGDTHWLGFQGKCVALISLADGKTVWNEEVPLRFEQITMPIVEGDEGIYFRNQDVMYAIDAKTGKPRWARQGVQFGAPSIVPGALYAWALVDGKRSARRLDPATGADAWVHELPSADELWIPGAVLPCGKDNGIVLFSYCNSDVEPCTLALDPATGAVLWSRGRRVETAWTEPGGAHVWLGSHDALTVTDPKTGDWGAEFVLENGHMELLVEGDRLVVTDFDEKGGDLEMQAFDVPRRELVWKSVVKGIRRPDRGDFSETVRVERLPRGIVLTIDATAGTIVDDIDPATGKVMVDRRTTWK